MQVRSIDQSSENLDDFSPEMVIFPSLILCNNDDLPREREIANDFIIDDYSIVDLNKLRRRQKKTTE